MICDFNNPVSMRYVDMSLESLKPLEDIISITPIQCTTPDTLPIRYPATKYGHENTPFYVSPPTDEGVDYCRDRYYGGTFCDHELYQCIMHSHMQLIERIANGEELMIMEHDCALVNEDSFRELFDIYWGCDGWFPGACMEVYGLSQRFARWMVNLMDDFPFTQKSHGWSLGDQRFSGPMGIITHSTVWDWNDGNRCTWLMPTKDCEEDDLICYADEPFRAQRALGRTYAPACKQFYFTKTKNTNCPDYSDILEDPTLNWSESGAQRRDFVFIDG